MRMRKRRILLSSPAVLGIAAAAVAAAAAPDGAEEFTADGNTINLYRYNQEGGMPDDSSGNYMLATVFDNGYCYPVGEGRFGNGQQLDYHGFQAITYTPGNEFTMESWVNFRSLERDGILMTLWSAGDDRARLELIQDDGRWHMRFVINDRYMVTGNSVALRIGEWYLIGAQLKDNVMSLIIDGRAVGSAPMPETLRDFTMVTMGEAAGGKPHRQAVDVILDETRISNIARYPVEKQQ